MGVHAWAEQAVEQLLQERQDNQALLLRALLSAVVERSKAVRAPEDLAQELLFLADNLDDERDYLFMRP